LRLVLSCPVTTRRIRNSSRSGPVRSVRSDPVGSYPAGPRPVRPSCCAPSWACRVVPRLAESRHPVQCWVSRAALGVQCRDGCAVSCRDSPSPLPCWACRVAPTLAVPCRDLPSLALPCRAVFRGRAACGVPRAVRGCEAGAGALPCGDAAPAGRERHLPIADQRSVGVPTTMRSGRSRRPPPRSPHRRVEFSTVGDKPVSYTGVIIPTVEEPVENSGAGVGTTVWRTRRSVENRVEPPERPVPTPIACGQ